MAQSTVANDTIVLKPSDLSNALLYLLHANRKPFVWGAPGIGKSDVVRQAAGQWFASQMPGFTCDAIGRVHDAEGKFVPYERYVIDIRAVLLDPVDLRGLPSVEGGKTKWNEPGFLPTEGCDPTVIFLDELTRAATMVQNGLLQLALDGKLGEYTLPKNCRIIAASNRESDGGGVTKATSALLGRFQHLDTEPDLEDWCRWALNSDIDPMVIAFLRFRPNLLNAFDRTARAWPNPRAWSFVSDISKQQPPKHLERAMVQGTVGNGATIEFMAFAELYRNLPSIDLILLDPKNAPVPTDVATLYAASSALASRSKPENFGRVLEYLGRLPSEYSVFAVRDACSRDNDLAMTPEFTRWAVDNADLLG